MPAANSYSRDTVPAGTPEPATARWSVERCAVIGVSRGRSEYAVIEGCVNTGVAYIRRIRCVPTVLRLAGLRSSHWKHFLDKCHDLARC